MSRGSALSAYLGGPRTPRRDDDDAPRRRRQPCTACGFRLDPVLAGRTTHYDGELPPAPTPAPTREEA